MLVALQQMIYPPFCPTTGWAYSNGLAMRRPVDLDYQPQAVEMLHTDTQGVQTAVGLRLGYVFDAVGNLIQLGDATIPGGPRDFGYDASNRMAQMSRLSQVKASYAYSGAGERVRKTTPGSVETYSLHDPAGRWVGDYESNGAPIQQAIWFGDLPVGVIATVPATAGQTQQKLFHLQPDMLGTPRAAVDPSRGATGTVVWT